MKECENDILKDLSDEDFVALEEATPIEITTSSSAIAHSQSDAGFLSYSYPPVQEGGLLTAVDTGFAWDQGDNEWDYDIASDIFSDSDSSIDAGKEAYDDGLEDDLSDLEVEDEIGGDSKWKAYREHRKAQQASQVASLVEASSSSQASTIAPSASYMPLKTYNVPLPHSSQYRRPLTSDEFNIVSALFNEKNERKWRLLPDGSGYFLFGAKIAQYAPLLYGLIKIEKHIEIRTEGNTLIVEGPFDDGLGFLARCAYRSDFPQPLRQEDDVVVYNTNKAARTERVTATKQGKDLQNTKCGQLFGEKNAGDWRRLPPQHLTAPHQAGWFIPLYDEDLPYLTQQLRQDYRRYPAKHPHLTDIPSAVIRRKENALIIEGSSDKVLAFVARSLYRVMTFQEPGIKGDEQVLYATATATKETNDMQNSPYVYVFRKEYAHRWNRLPEKEGEGCFYCADSPEEAQKISGSFYWQADGIKKQGPWVIVPDPEALAKIYGVTDFQAPGIRGNEQELYAATKHGKDIRNSPYANLFRKEHAHRWSRLPEEEGQGYFYCADSPEEAQKINGSFWWQADGVKKQGLTVTVPDPEALAKIYGVTDFQAPGIRGNEQELYATATATKEKNNFRNSPYANLFQEEHAHRWSRLPEEKGPGYVYRADSPEKAQKIRDSFRQQTDGVKKQGPWVIVQDPEALAKIYGVTDFQAPGIRGNAQELHTTANKHGKDIRNSTYANLFREEHAHRWSRLPEGYVYRADNPEEAEKIRKSFKRQVDGVKKQGPWVIVSAPEALAKIYGVTDFQAPTAQNSDRAALPDTNVSDAIRTGSIEQSLDNGFGIATKGPKRPSYNIELENGRDNKKRKNATEKDTTEVKQPEAQSDDRKIYEQAVSMLTALNTRNAAPPSIIVRDIIRCGTLNSAHLKTRG